MILTTRTVLKQAAACGLAGFVAAAPARAADIDVEAEVVSANGLARCNPATGVCRLVVEEPGPGQRPAATATEASWLPESAAALLMAFALVGVCSRRLRAD
jgi:hypothetical protein